ncbi:MAG TPA: hypothetical protein VE287_01795, partial [Actinopolymorphaceae bacterium]|nr:hypothetical protein [Actinopolymorphaceae bacterium]
MVGGTEIGWRHIAWTGRRVAVWETEARRLRLVQLRLECIRHNDGGRVVRASGTDPDEIATCSVGRFADGFEVLFSADADALLVGRATALPAECFFDDTVAAADHIGAGRGLRITRCSTYVFAHRPTAVHDPGVVRRGPEDHAAVHAGREVAWA